MLIQRLNMFGFKTFADETVIDFERGVTVVLGPNGTGKSNIVEAFLWILGEQSHSNLRVDRNEGLEGLIFRGTEEKKRSGYASVALTFDNSNHWLPYDTPDVNVKREYFRSGESNVFINDTPVRLKDLTDLFLGTGLGKNAYSVIKQGTVDKIVEQTPEERRFLIEEAAGISKYIEKRKEALRRLEESDNNLATTRTTLREVEKQYRTLKEQAERTERYYRLKDEMKKAMIDINLWHIIRAREMEKSLANDITALNDRRSIIEAEFASLGERKKDELSRFEQVNAEVLRLDKQVFQAYTDISHIQQNVNSLSGQRANTASDLTDAKQRKSKFEEKFAACNSELTRLEQERNTVHDTVNTLSAEQDTHLTRIDEEKRRIETATARRTEIETSIRALNERIQGARVKQKELIDKIISEIDTKKRDVEKLSIYQNKDKLEHDIEIGFSNILSSLDGKMTRIAEFESLGVLTAYSDTNFKRLTEFVAQLKDKLDIERKETNFLKQIFEEYNKIKDPFIELLFAKEGTYRQKETIDQEIAVCEFDIVRFNRDVEGIEREIAEAREAIERANARIAAISVESARLTEQFSGIESNIVRVTADRTEVEQELAQAAARIEKLEHSLKNIETEHATGNTRLTELRERHSALEKEFKQKSKEQKEAQENISGFEENITRQFAKLEEIKEQGSRLQQRFIDTQSKIENIYTNFYENHATDLREFEKQAQEKKIDEEKLREKIEKLKEQIKDLGTINEMALDEFYESKERFEFLTAQKEDLEKAHTEIVKVIEESNREATTLFRKAFDEINVNFEEIYGSLFAGGRAGLTLTNEENILETGIEIFVQQTGKKRENIVSNSGGERSMIGLALIFAIFKARPSPFCILDEVDAALDAANVIRFKEMVARFSEKTQFLIITHNEITATIANTYYGVTQAQKGVSSIFTVRVNSDGSINDSGKVKLIQQ